MGHVIALCGGVGGAKLAHGLTHVLAPEDLTIVVNTGDDFEHLGLLVSPDVDTVVYTLSDLADRVRGWGLAGETWGFMAALKRLGGEDWFNLGDHDLAMHVRRRQLLDSGLTLSAVTARLAGELGLKHAITPMTDDPVRTIVDTDAGPLAFQHYFVRERCAPVATAIRFEGADQARISPGFAAVLARKDIDAIVVCPSNPYLSVDPILALPRVRDMLRATGAPIIAVSPIVAGQAIKGPAAKLMAELGAPPTVTGVAAHYSGLLDALVLDEADRALVGQVESQGMRAFVAPTVMRGDADRIQLAKDCLAFACGLGPRA